MNRRARPVPLNGAAPGVIPPRPRPPEPIGAVLAGAIVLNLDPAAPVLAAALRALRRQAHRNGLPFDSRLLQLLQVAERGEETLAALRVPRPEPVQVPEIDTSGSTRRPSEPVETLASTAVAELAGVSDRAVRKAARVGTLAGDRTGYGWQFTRSQVEAWMARRAPRATREETAA